MYNCLVGPKIQSSKSPHCPIMRDEFENQFKKTIQKYDEKIAKILQ